MKIPKILLSLLILPAPLWALSNDREQPIHVSADTLEMDEQSGLSTYEGNVLMTQGSIRIESDKLLIIQNDQQAVDHFKMWGEPVHFEQRNDRNEPIKGRALYMEYHNESGELVLQREAYLDSNGDTVESELIRANTETEYVKAGDAKSKKRVRMLILPRNNDN